MIDLREFEKSPRYYAELLVENEATTWEYLARAMMMRMTPDHVRDALEANELDPRFILVTCSDCDDSEFRGMDGEVDEDTGDFTCQHCLDQRDEEEDDDDDEDGD